MNTSHVHLEALFLLPQLLGYHAGAKLRADNHAVHTTIRARHRREHDGGYSQHRLWIVCSELVLVGVVQYYSIVVPHCGDVLSLSTSECDREGCFLDSSELLVVWWVFCDRDRGWREGERGVMIVHA